MRQVEQNKWKHWVNSQLAPSVKPLCLPVQETQETWVRSLGWEDPLEEKTATHSSVLAWKILGTEEPGGLQSMGVTKSQTGLSTAHSYSCVYHPEPCLIHSSTQYMCTMLAGLQVTKQETVAETTESFLWRQKTGNRQTSPARGAHENC